ncbi:hypothetical protein ACH4GK_01360 [Streptomyces rimosus]|uniref:hypothetical protein n=1 Tax=Streptomyces rimosus TaxID=1927 RepID=UPI0004CC4008|nr:hypothetical protein [Streptomyces rimosus]
MSTRTVEPGDAREHTGLWLLDCALRYFAVFSVGWVAAWATFPREGWYALLGVFGLFAYSGLPSLVIIMLLSGRRTLREQDEFRVLASMLLLIPLVPLLLLGWRTLFFVAVQLGFVWWLLPLPTRCVLAAVEPGRERERQRWAK